MELQSLLISPIKKDVLLRDYTTYKVGGIAPMLVTPKNVEELINVLKYLKEHKMKYKVLGNGSNVIFNDSGYDGVIIKLDEFQN